MRLPATTEISDGCHEKALKANDQAVVSLGEEHLKLVHVRFMRRAVEQRRCHDYVN